MTRTSHQGSSKINYRCKCCRRLRKNFEPDGNHGGEYHRLRTPHSAFWTQTPFGACCGFCVVRHIVPEVARERPEDITLLREYVAFFRRVRPRTKYAMLRRAQAVLAALDAPTP